MNALQSVLNQRVDATVAELDSEDLRTSAKERDRSIAKLGGTRAPPPLNQTLAAAAGIDDVNLSLSVVVDGKSFLGELNIDWIWERRERCECV
ncbi:MAG: hypothetical protein U0164_01590 [Gemmatimonadaceae bacterium]